MKLFKKQVTIKEDELFKENGEFNLTTDLANLLDTILIVCLANGTTDLYKLNLELRRCGFFITIGDLRKITDSLIKDGMISNSTIKGKIEISSN